MLSTQADYKIGGLEDPGYAEDLSRFIRAQRHQQWIQILHDGSNHWVTSSHDKGVVKNMIPSDSKWTGNINPTVHLQLGSIYGNLAKGVSLFVDICHVERREGSNDCGVYAIAYATDLAHGRNPYRYSYLQADMRKHLMECLEKEFLSPFPGELEYPRSQRPTRVILDIF